MAETEDQARDAAEAIVAEIDEEPAVVDMGKALEDGSPLVHDEIGTNQCFDWGWIEDNRAATDAAIKAAPHVTTLELVNNRLVPNAMEPRASMAEYDPGTGDYTLYTTSQNPHLTRLLISAFVLGIPENKLRVVAPDVGRRLRLEDLSTTAKRRWCWRPRGRSAGPCAGRPAAPKAS